MFKIILYIYITISFFIPPALSTNNIYIYATIDDNIITNLDIKKEGEYLKSLNKNLIKLDNDKIFDIAKHSLINEIIKKKEIEKFVNLDSNIIFLGKEKLKQIKSEGIKKKLMGVILEAKEISLSGSLDIKDEKSNKVGELRSACYSPHFEKVIGIAMLDMSFLRMSKSVKIDIKNSTYNGKVCDLPFI